MTNATIESTADERNLIEYNPAIRRAGWLPRGLWPELDHVAERHDEAIARLAEVTQEAMDLGRSFKQEDEQRASAYATGLEVPEMTDPGERQRAVADSRAKVEGAEMNLQAAATAAVRTIQEHQAEWQEDLKRRSAEAERKRDEALRVLHDAIRATGGLKRTVHWVDRTATNRRRGHISHDELPVAEPEPLPDLANLDGVAVEYVPS